MCIYCIYHVMSFVYNFITMFGRFLSLHSKLYFKEFLVLGTVAGVAGGTVDFAEYQLEKVNYYNKLGGLVEKTHTKPELIRQLDELNTKATEIKENSNGFFESIVGGIALGGISIEQKEILDKLKLYEGVGIDFKPPKHVWLNLNDSLSYGLVKSVAFGGIIGGGILSFYYVTLPSIGFHNMFKQYVNNQLHDQEIEKAKQKQLEKS